MYVGRSIDRACLDPCCVHTAQRMQAGTDCCLASYAPLVPLELGEIALAHIQRVEKRGHGPLRRVRRHLFVSLSEVSRVQPPTIALGNQQQPTDNHSGTLTQTKRGTDPPPHTSRRSTRSPPPPPACARVPRSTRMVSGCSSLLLAPVAAWAPAAAGEINSTGSVPSKSGRRRSYPSAPPPSACVVVAVVSGAMVSMASVCRCGGCAVVVGLVSILLEGTTGSKPARLGRARVISEAAVG